MRKAESGGALSRRITLNPKVLLEEGFAFGEKRLEVTIVPVDVVKTRRGWFF
jgi:hypothetical protein